MCHLACRGAMTHPFPLWFIHIMAKVTCMYLIIQRGFLTEQKKPWTTAESLMNHSWFTFINSQDKLSCNSGVCTETLSTINTTEHFKQHKLDRIKLKLLNTTTPVLFVCANKMQKIAKNVKENIITCVTSTSVNCTICNPDYHMNTSHTFLSAGRRCRSEKIKKKN